MSTSNKKKLEKIIIKKNPLKILFQNYKIFLKKIFFTNILKYGKKILM